MKKIVLIFLAVCTFVSNVHAQNEINGYEYVDLGLSVKWATCNIGANAPHEYGNYYAWGETSTKNKYNKYNSRTYGYSMGDISGNASCDAARANWGSSWRMPTIKEMEELTNKCTWTWINRGTKGYKVTGPSGNSIFLPAAGHYFGEELEDNEEGSYWVSTPYESYDTDAYCFYFFYIRHHESRSDRYYGYTIRPVSD
ncbi:MAG: DUF1566 domain-containing protein [Bacteroidales bacterium]|nr:DUF1566 domain-containing protein [Bacteroidales bacterium]